MACDQPNTGLLRRPDSRNTVVPKGAFAEDAASLCFSTELSDLQGIDVGPAGRLRGTWRTIGVRYVYFFPADGVP